jgi:O-antigen/teichoic acid export membrane protein
LVQRGLPFVLLPVLASAVGPQAYGRLTLILTASAGIASLLSFGLETHVFRVYYKYANDLDERTAQLNVAATLTLGGPIIAAVGLTLAYAAVGSISGYSVEAVGLGLFAVAVQASVQTFPMSLLRAQERVTTYVVACAIFAVANVVLSVMLVLVVHGGIIGWLIANFVASVLCLVVAMKAVDWRFRPQVDLRRIREALNYGLPLIPHQISHWALGLSDRLIVGIYCTTAAVGVYSLAAQLALPVGLLVTAIQLGIMPEYGRALNRNTESAVLSEAVTVSVAAVVAVGAAMALLGPCVIALVVSHKYSEAVELLPWISLGYTFFGLYLIPMNSITVVAGRTQFVWMPTALAAVVTIGANFIIVPKYGIYGAAVVSAVGYAVLLVGVAVLSLSMDASIVRYQWKAIALICGVASLGYYGIAELGDPRTIKGAVVRLVGWIVVVAGGAGFVYARRGRRADMRSSCG